MSESEAVLLRLAGVSADSGCSGRFDIYIYKLTDQQFVKVVESTLLNFVGGDLTTFASELLFRLGGSKVARLVSPDNMMIVLKKTNKFIFLDVDDKVVRVTDVKNGMSHKTLFSGYYKNLLLMDDPVVKLVDQIRTKEGKLLRFKYNGGTKKGETRIIRLESVVGTGNNAVLKGIDLAHALAKNSTDKGFRTFNVSKIDGPGVEILD